MEKTDPIREEMARALEDARPLVELAHDVGDQDDIEAAKALLPRIDALLSKHRDHSGGSRRE